MTKSGFERRRSIARVRSVWISARCQHAELVALGVGEHDPRDIALPDVDPPGSECDETLDLRILLAVDRWCDVEMQPVLPRLGRAGVWAERHERSSSVGCSDGGVAVLVVHDRPPGGLTPEPADDRVGRLENDGAEQIGGSQKVASEDDAELV